MDRPDHSTSSNSEYLLEQLKLDFDVLQKDQVEILSFISHDIKAPLNRLFALIQLLVHDQKDLNAQQVAYLDKMEIVIADMRLMMQNLTDYRNLEHRDVQLNPAKIPLSAFLRKSVSPFEAIARKKEITFIVNASGDQIVNTDQYSISRIMDNLLSNAVKFSQPGREVTIALNESDHHFIITVRDQARGFKPDEHRQLFHTKFQKFSITPTAGESATGLGLYVAAGFAKKINAHLTCETQAGTGSTFTLSVPR